MSAYSEWKYGLITDMEYASICRQEEDELREMERYGNDYDEEDFFEDDDIDEF